LASTDESRPSKSYWQAFVTPPGVLDSLFAKAAVPIYPLAGRAFASSG
jgi:hypothetical protein